MGHEIDKISEALGSQKAQIYNLKETVVNSNSSMEKKIDKVLTRMEDINTSVIKAHHRLDHIEPTVIDYKQTKRKAILSVLGLSALGGTSATGIVKAVQIFFSSGGGN